MKNYFLPMELTHQQIMNSVPTLRQLQQARLPVRSSVRLAHTLSALEDKLSIIQEENRNLIDQYQKTDEDGNGLFRLDETAVQAADEDPSDFDDEVTGDHRFASDVPAVDDRESLNEETEKLYSDTVEVEIRQFPADELEDVSIAVEKFRIEQTEDDESAADVDPGFRTADIQSILFMFPQDL